MEDIDVFIFCTHHKEKYEIPNELIIQYLRNITKITAQFQDLKTIMEDTPTTTQLVQGLLNQGFKPSYIAEYLDIAQPTVSYHSNRKIKRPYVNRGLSNLRQLRVNLIHNPSAIINGYKPIT